LWNPTATAYQSENGIPNDVMFCSLLLLGSSEQNMTSLGIPFSDWMNENVSQLVAEHVSSVNGSIEQHGEYKFSNKFSNLLSNVWLV